MANAVPWIVPRAAYIHIPFCAHHCGYCDFAVVTHQDHQIDLYLEALELELQRLQTPRPVQTRFIGGGTPTYLSLAQLERLLAMLQQWLPLEGKVVECTIESTPESLDAEKCQLLAEAGVNRISIGVQSFHNHHLSTLERLHRADVVDSVVVMAAKFLPHRSLDLIFGVPGQTMEDWQQDIEHAISLPIDHLSTYGLTYEKGTPLWKQLHRGQLTPVAEDIELEMYLFAMRKLQECGFSQYEISNFAKAGGSCLHNEVYWANHAYYGFGLGAARYVHLNRELNTRSFSEYLRRCFRGEDPTFQRETLSEAERALETLAIQLRRARGIHRTEFQIQTGYSLDEIAGDAFSPFLDSGHLQDDGTSIALTTTGKCVADSVIAQIFSRIRNTSQWSLNHFPSG